MMAGGMCMWLFDGSVLVVGSSSSIWLYKYNKAVRQSCLHIYSSYKHAPTNIFIY